MGKVQSCFPACKMEIIALSPFLNLSHCSTNPPTSRHRQKKKRSQLRHNLSPCVCFFTLYHPKCTDFTVLAKARRWHTKPPLIQHVTQKNQISFCGREGNKTRGTSWTSLLFISFQQREADRGEVSARGNCHAGSRDHGQGCRAGHGKGSPPSCWAPRTSGAATIYNTHQRHAK